MHHVRSITSLASVSSVAIVVFLVLLVFLVLFVLEDVIIRPLQVVVWLTARITLQLQVFAIIGIEHVQLCHLPFYMCSLVFIRFISTLLVSLTLLDPIL